MTAMKFHCAICIYKRPHACMAHFSFWPWAVSVTHTKDAKLCLKQKVQWAHISTVEQVLVAARQDGPQRPGREWDWNLQLSHQILLNTDDHVSPQRGSTQGGGPEHPCRRNATLTDWGFNSSLQGCKKPGADVVRLSLLLQISHKQNEARGRRLQSHRTVLLWEGCGGFDISGLSEDKVCFICRLSAESLYSHSYVEVIRCAVQQLLLMFRASTSF